MNHTLPPPETVIEMSERHRAGREWAARFLAGDRPEAPPKKPEKTTRPSRDKARR